MSWQTGLDSVSTKTPQNYKADILLTSTFVLRKSLRLFPSSSVEAEHKRSVGTLSHICSPFCLNRNQSRSMAAPCSESLESPESSRQSSVLPRAALHIHSSSRNDFHPSSQRAGGLRDIRWRILNGIEKACGLKLPRLELFSHLIVLQLQTSVSFVRLFRD